MGAHTARRAAAALREAIRERGTARLVVATGSSQFEVLDALVHTASIDWLRVDGFHLDEYVGLDIEHPASFCGYLRERFVSRVPLRSFHYLRGDEDARDECQRASAAVTASRIDVSLIGIGENAHLAFNDPPADFETPLAYHTVPLDVACRQQQVGEGWFASLDLVPTHAMSMTVPQILKSRLILCSVPDARKATAVAAAIDGPIAPDVPASILRLHANVEVILDRAAAQQLKYASLIQQQSNDAD